MAIRVPISSKSGQIVHCVFYVAGDAFGGDYSFDPFDPYWATQRMGDDPEWEMWIEHCKRWETQLDG